MRISDLHRRILAQNQPLLLDAFPNAAAAFSLRKLRTAYTGNCIQVRRSSDNTLQNIGFVNNVLDTSSLLSFVGAGSGFVRTWYDQSGNLRDYSNTTNANQPRIVNSGVLETDLGKPIIRFISANSTRLTRNGEFLQMHNHSFFNIAKTLLPITSTKYFFSFRNSGTGTGTSKRIYNNYANDVLRYSLGNTSVSMSTSSFISSTVLMAGNSSSGEQNFYVDGSFISSANNNEIETPERTAIGALVDNLGTGFGNYGDFLQHELIFYPNNQSSNRTAIENNINSFYNIY
jgi:hypothetical protein